MVAPPGKRFAGPGYCIYCFRKPPEVTLTDEHIWPESLYGYDLILDGSCTACAAELTKLDGYLARHVYYKLRLRCGMKSKRKKSKGHPTHATTPYFRNGQRETVTTPVKDAGFSVALPKYRPPGILCGRPPEQFFGEMALEVHQYFEEVLPYVRSNPGDVLLFPDAPRINPLKFARAMIKIAYCIGVSVWGIDRFRNSLLPKMILGEDDRFPYVFGSPPEPTPSYIDMEALHRFDIMRFGPHLTVRLRPFATYGSHNAGSPVGFPIYEAVIGEITEEEWREGPRPALIR
jgi:hypothetical protein